MVVKLYIGKGRTDNRFRMQYVISDLPGKYRAACRPVIVADYTDIQIHAPRSATRQAAVARDIGQQGGDVDLMAGGTALRHDRLAQAQLIIGHLHRMAGRGLGRGGRAVRERLRPRRKIGE